jgi:hypothetical protein
MDMSRSFVGGLLARLTGPMHFRLIVQPLVGIGLGIRDGLRDAKAGRAGPLRHRPSWHANPRRRPPGGSSVLPGACRH